jgi:hypothetical protein
MNFNDLMAKMRELDQPTVQAQAPVQSAPVEECGEPMMGNMPSPMSDKPDTPPPSMSINVNAQGLDDIADLMKLLTKVNPDMMPQGDVPPLPSLGGEPNLLSIKPAMPPLKMLPDFDAEEPMDGPGPDLMNPSSDNVSKAQGDIDGDGDHDMDDHEAEKDKDKEEKESFANAGGSDPAYMGVDSVTQSGDDLNKSKQMFKHSYKQGDNPMAMKEGDLRSQIKAELAQRLAEAKAK